MLQIDAMNLTPSMCFLPNILLQILLLHKMLEVTYLPFDFRMCQDECLDSKLVKGKIVLCNASRGVMETNRVGAIGVIGQRSKAENFAHVVPLPASGFAAKDFGTILSYFKSAK